MAKTQSELAEDMFNLLSEERDILMTGRLESIPDLADRKANLIEELNSMQGSSLNGVNDLKRMVLRNQELLDEALRGIRDVINRMSELKRVRDNLETYDDKGERLTIQASKPSFEKRA